MKDVEINIKVSIWLASYLQEMCAQEAGFWHDEDEPENEQEWKDVESKIETAIKLAADPE